MKYNVDGWNNFCRVFALPQYPRGYCFGSGKSVTFTMMDWFNPVEDIDQPAVSKAVWEEKAGPIEAKEVDGDDLQEKLLKFLQEKMYVDKGFTYLVVCDFGLAFTFEASSDQNDAGVQPQQSRC